MKNLYLMRHGKSSWKYTELSDFERPLNKRGRRDVPFMARLFKKLDIQPDLIISSPALRAYFTARSIAREINYPLNKIESSEVIYESGVNELFQLIQSFNNEHNSVLITGHNPGLTILSNALTKNYIENIPTTGLVSIELETDSWSNVTEGSGNVKIYEYPKKYLQ